MGFVIADLDKRWPGSVVPYEVNGTDFPPGSAGSDMIRDAINIWNETSLVQWIPRNGHADFVMFQTGSACNSPVGRQTGQQSVSCQVGSGFARGNVIHEMGHAMGLIHEQSRPDRATFVTVTGTGTNYDIRNDGISVDNYDFSSIMHYANDSLISNNLPGGASMGQRISPSRTDLAAIRLAYPIHDITILADTSDIREALAGHNGNLFLAWQGSGNTNLNVSLSTDGGATFTGKHTSPETSSHAPALASHNGRLFIAWKGDGNDDLNVAKVDVLGNSSGAVFVGGLVDKITLGESSDLAPALASHDGRLFLAWKGSGNDNLNLAFSEDAGASFAGKVTFPETSDDSPALVSHNGGLYMAWKGSGNENLNIAHVDLVASTSGAFGIDGLSNKVTLAETSDFSPALGSSEGLLYMAWRGSGNENLNIIASVDGFSFFDKRVSFESSSDAPALASLERRLFYGWKGSNNENLNIGSVTAVIRPVGHAQNGNMIHGTGGNKGNFEVLLAASGQIQHYFRNNDAGGLPWSGTPALLQPPGASPIASCLIQSRAPSFDLAAIHWVQPAAGPARLLFSQNVNSGGWSAPAPIVADGSAIQGVTGKPSLLQGTFGSFGNFEIAVPIGSRISHFWRDNDAAGTPWHGPVTVADFTSVAGPVVPVSVSMVQSSFGNPGNLELVARTTQAARIQHSPSGLPRIPLARR